MVECIQTVQLKLYSHQTLSEEERGGLKGSEDCREVENVPTELCCMTTLNTCCFCEQESSRQWHGRTLAVSRQ